MDDETQFLVWVKRKLVSARTKDVVNLVSSGVTTAFANNWLVDTIANHGHVILERSAEPNEFGLPSLKQAIRAAFQIPAEREIDTTSGASGAIRLICEQLLAGGSGVEFVVESPVYEPIRAIPERLGAKIVLVDRARGVDAIARAVTENTSAVFLSNLHNPTGHWLSHEELSDLSQRLDAAGSRVLMVVDETFSDLGPQPGTSAASIGPRLVTISSLSKCHGLASLRCGWITADPTALPNFVNDAVLFDNIGGKFTDVLGAMALEAIDAFRQAARQHVDRNRELVSEWLKQTADAGLIEPQQVPFGCVVFVQVLNCDSAAALAEQLDARYGVIVAPGRFFGEAFDDCLRIGFGGSYDELHRGLARLTAGLAALKRLA